MHGHEFINIILGLCSLLFIASALYIISKKVKFIDFSVLLVVAGIYLSFFHIEFFEAIRLEPETVLLVFLPILLFESAFNFDFRDFRKILAPAFWLSTIGLIVSAIIIAFPLHFFFNIDIIAALVFGSIISSTDPIAVLSIFKQLGVPKRLQLLVDAESFLNDGTSVIASRILVSFLGLSFASIGGGELFSGFLNFIYVFFGGIIVGVFLGWVFSKLISVVKNISYVEITLTIICAHFVFIIADSFLKVSGIIAILGAGLVLGNYGRTKISPKVLSSMHDIWGLLVFITTSIIFFLIGYEISLVKLFNEGFIIIAVVIFVLIGRALSVYLVGGAYSFFAKKENKIPLSWMHIANWGGLRGALPLIVLFGLPDSDILPRDTFINIALGAILFTLIFNALTIKPLIKLLKIDQLDDINKVEINLTEAFVMKNLLEHLKKLKTYGDIGEKLYVDTTDQLKNKLSDITDTMKNLSSNDKFFDYENTVQKVIARYCLHAEKSAYTDLFKKNIIPEAVYLKLTQSLAVQIDNIDKNGIEFKDGSGGMQNIIHGIKVGSETIKESFIIKLLVKVFDLDSKRKIDKMNLLYHKARVIGDEFVLREIKEFSEYDFIKPYLLNTIINNYKYLLERNRSTLDDIKTRDPNLYDEVERLFIKFESKNLIDQIVEEFGEDGRVSIKSIQNIKVNI